MARKNLYFIAALLLVSAVCYAPGIQGGIFDPPPSSASDNPIDIANILNRLDQIELETGQLKKKNVEFELEIGQLKKKNVELEQKLESILTIPAPGDESSNYGLSKQNAVATSSAPGGRYYMPRSCYEIKASNPNATTGLYFIDPDGQIDGDDAVQVHCDMATGTTSIFHDTEQMVNVPSCATAGCYTRQIKYSATTRQMALLADISASCQQYFKFESLSVPFEVNGIQYGFWNDRNGDKQIFWAGPANTKHTCQCGRESPNNCIDTQHTCNADSMAPVQLSDEGYITATSLLPVTKLNFGRTSLTGVRASYTLGRLQCTGKVYIPSKPESCKALFQMGHTLSGFYLLKSGNTKIVTSYCDFSKGSTEAGYETRIGNVDVISSAVQFFVTRNTDWSTLNTPMTFQVARLNVGNAMDISSGIFKATKAGTYSFAFSAQKTGTSTNTLVHLRLNGNTVGIADFTTGYYLSSSIHATLKLKVNDEVTLVLTSGTIYDNINYHTHFTGILLEEDLVIS